MSSSKFSQGTGSIIARTQLSHSLLHCQGLSRLQASKAIEFNSWLPQCLAPSDTREPQPTSPHHQDNYDNDNTNQLDINQHLWYQNKDHDTKHCLQLTRHLHSLEATTGAMRITNSSPTQLAIAALLAVAPLSTTAIPYDATLPNPAYRHESRQVQPAQRAQTSIFPQITWLRDSVVEYFFPPTPKIETPKDFKVEKRPPGSRVPAKVRARYGKDVVLRFRPSTEEEADILKAAANTLFVDIWATSNEGIDLRISEDDLPTLLALIPKALNDTHYRLIPDLSDAIYKTYPSPNAKLPSFSKAQVKNVVNLDGSLRVEGGDNENIFFKEYQPLSVIVPWMKLMASMFTTHVQLITIGITYEGREIQALRVGVMPSNNQEVPMGRKTVMVNGGSHAREWISTSSVTYIAWSMITQYGKNSAITKLVEGFDWVFIPTLNPDGYVYSWDNDRLWRKNRQATSLRFCKGIDLDRSFRYQWDGATYQSNPCSESFPGEEPFQGKEAQEFANWAENEEKNNNVSFVGLLDLHSYSQQVLYPYSYSCDVEPPTLENLEELGIGLAKAIRVSSGEYYTVMSACEGGVGMFGKLNPLKSQTESTKSTKSSKSKSKKFKSQSLQESGGGSAIDWFYHELKVRYAYQLKLRDTGSYGFLLPSESIVPVGQEAFDAVKYFGAWMAGNKGIESQELEIEEEENDEGLGKSVWEEMKKEGEFMELDAVVEAKKAWKDEESEGSEDWVVVEKEKGEKPKVEDMESLTEYEIRLGESWELKRRRR